MIIKTSRCIERMLTIQPLVHCIVSPVAMRDCANILLAVGARPVMAQAPEEVAEVAANADCVVLNTGTISITSAEAMRIAGRTASELGRPVVLDLVGVGLSSLRSDLCHELIRIVRPTILKGNASEARFLLCGQSCAKGVDAHAADEPDEHLLKIASDYSQAHNAVLLITGPTDYIISPNKTISVGGGHPMMGRITATGCMSGVLCGAFSVGADPLEAVCSAMCFMAMAGEAAALKSKGTGSFGIVLLDEISRLEPNDILKRGDLIHEIKF